MANTLLITQCLQRDFVDPIGPHDPLPNLLHVGHLEATRLLGPDPEVGPLAQLMQWAHALPHDAIDIVHLRDWHDPDDPRQAEHLRAFGPHCLRDSDGARLVLHMDERAAHAPNEHLVDTITLNDFVDTELEAVIRDAQLAGDGAPLRVGVIGVWTEAKVSFLLYELKTRLRIEALATCSALTASASRAQHFNALAQLHKILGVECFESVAGFADWLQPGAQLELPEAGIGFQPAIDGLPDDAPLSEADRAIVGHLFRDSARVHVTPLTGGFSEARVLRATSEDSLGHHHAPSVVKLGPNRVIAQERIAFEQVEEILGNNAPRVRGFVDLGDRAGLKYSYAAMGVGDVRTLKDLFEQNVPLETIDAVLRAAFDEVLAPLYLAARYERLPLFEHYEFSTRWVPSVRAKVAALVADPQATTFEFPGGHHARNVCWFYEDVLAHEWLPNHEYHYVSYVHGDLNAANILIDTRDNVWIIDFFHTATGHVLKDLAKLENDLLYILTPLRSDHELAEALTITTALREVEDLYDELPRELPTLRTPALARAWQTLVTLRRVGGRLCREDRNAQQLRIALLRYAVHALGFDESSPLQKQWALAAAGTLAEDVSDALQRDRVLRVDWVALPTNGRGRLGITICPGRRDRGRDLEDDLAELRRQGARLLVCLLPDAELEWAGVSALPAAASAAGLRYIGLPMPDQGVPDLADAARLVAECRSARAAGETVVLCCMGGLGRSGTIGSCVLVDEGLSARAAIETVREARGPRAIETLVQEQFIADYADR